MKSSASAALALLFVGCAHAPLATRDDVLWFGGDVYLGQNGSRVLDGVPLDGPLVVNLEGAIAEAPAPEPRLLNPLRAGEVLRAARVIAAGVENNHADDDGAAGRARTKDVLVRAGVTPLGRAKVGPATVVQVDLSAGVPPDLAARLGGGEHPKVVLFHVLAPSLYFPEQALEAAVEVALAAGADAVLSHGSHSVARVERRGRAVIAWGLGNVVFDCTCTRETEGLLVRLQFRDGAVSEAEVVPIDAGLDGAPARLAHDLALELQTLETIGSRFTAKTARGARF